jgi:Flp pilus assembly protein TadG
MVELALSLVALLPMAYGVVSYGTQYLVRAGLENAVRAGARYGSNLPLRTTELAAFKEAVRVRTAEGKAAGLAVQDVTVNVEFERGAPVRIKVKAEAGRTSAEAVFPYLGEWRR